MSWIYCRECYGSTAALLSTAGECRLIAEVAAAVRRTGDYRAQASSAIHTQRTMESGEVENNNLYGRGKRQWHDVMEGEKKADV